MVINGTDHHEKPLAECTYTKLALSITSPQEQLRAFRVREAEDLPQGLHSFCHLLLYPLQAEDLAFFPFSSFCSRDEKLFTLASNLEFI